MSEMTKYPWYVSVTYLLYIIVWDGGIMGAAFYVVFWLGHSGWWILAAVFIAGCAFQPQQWSALFDPVMANKFRVDERRT